MKPVGYIQDERISKEHSARAT